METLKMLYRIVNDNGNYVSAMQAESCIVELEQQLAKQAEIISVLKDCVETIAECEVCETAAKLSSKATLKRVGILEAKYKEKE